MKKINFLHIFTILSGCATVKTVPSTYNFQVESSIKDVRNANNLIQTALIRDGFTLKRNDQQMGIMESDVRAVAVPTKDAFPVKMRYRSNFIISKSGVEVINTYDCSMAAASGVGLIATMNYSEYGACSVTTWGKTPKKDGPKNILVESIETENARLMSLIKTALSK